MKQTVLVKLAPTPAQHASLLRTLEAFNAACNAVAEVAFAHRMANKIELQKLVYFDIRQQFGLSAQMAIRAISKVAEAYKRDKHIKPSFRPHGAMVCDERICSFPAIDRVSLLTLDGRVGVPFRFGAYAEGMLARKRGQADLLYRKSTDTFFLAVTVDAPEPAPDEASEYLGVDLGIITLATTSDGDFLNHSTGPKHAHINQVRARYGRFRQAVNALPEDLRVVVVLRFYGGMNATEVGIGLGIPAGTVRTRLKRALAALRDDLRAAHAWSPISDGGQRSHG